MGLDRNKVGCVGGSRTGRLSVEKYPLVCSLRIVDGHLHNWVCLLDGPPALSAVEGRFGFGDPPEAGIGTGLADLARCGIWLATVGFVARAASQ